jgi:hypothetical protein
MTERRNQFCSTRAALSTGGRAKNPMPIIILIIAVVASLLGFAPACQAALYYAQNPGTAAGNQSSYFSAGSDFTVQGNPIQVTALGVYDDGGNGLISSHDVAIWTSAGGDPLVRLMVPAGTGGTLVGGFRYYPLSSPVELAANTLYVIEAWYNTGDADTFKLVQNRSDVTIDPAVHWERERWRYSGSANEALFATNIRNDGLGYFGPSFAFDVVAVPEPGTWTSILSVGVIGVAIAAQHVRRKTSV